MENRLSPPDAVIQYPDGTPQNALQQLPLTKRDAIDMTGMYCGFPPVSTLPDAVITPGAQAIEALQLLRVDPPPLNANAVEHFLEFIGI